jgi:hypothetical protein
LDGQKEARGFEGWARNLIKFLWEGFERGVGPNKVAIVKGAVSESCVNVRVDMERVNGKRRFCRIGWGAYFSDEA